MRSAFTLSQEELRRAVCEYVNEEMDTDIDEDMFEISFLKDESVLIESK